MFGQDWYHRLCIIFDVLNRYWYIILFGIYKCSICVRLYRPARNFNFLKFATFFAMKALVQSTSLSTLGPNFVLIVWEESVQRIFSTAAKFPQGNFDLICWTPKTYTAILKNVLCWRNICLLRIIGWWDQRATDSGLIGAIFFKPLHFLFCLLHAIMPILFQISLNLRFFNMLNITR